MKTKPKPVGISLYKPEYAQQIVELMSLGHSLKAAAAEIGYSIHAIANWREKYPEFREAIELGFGKRTLKLERDLLTAKDAATVTSRIFSLKSAAPEEYTDRYRTEITGANGGPIETKEVSALELLESRITGIAERLPAPDQKPH